MPFSTGADVFQLDLTALRRGSFTVRRGLSAEDLQITPEDASMAGSVEATLEVSLRGNRVLLRGALKGRILAPCRRCLEGLERTVEAHVALAYRLAAGVVGGPLPDGEEPGTDEVEDEDQTVEIPGHANLTPGLRDCFLLQIPDRPLCREDCRGLCPRCGTNLNLNDCGCPERT